MAISPLILLGGAALFLAASKGKSKSGTNKLPNGGGNGGGTKPHQPEEILVDGLEEFEDVLVVHPTDDVVVKLKSQADIANIMWNWKLYTEATSGNPVIQVEEQDIQLEGEGQPYVREFRVKVLDGPGKVKLTFSEENSNTNQSRSTADMILEIV